MAISQITTSSADAIDAIIASDEKAMSIIGLIERITLAAQQATDPGKLAFLGGRIAALRGQLNERLEAIGLEPAPAQDCARCASRGRIEVSTIMGRMLDACPDCTQPNNFF